MTPDQFNTAIKWISFPLGKEPDKIRVTLANNRVVNGAWDRPTEEVDLIWIEETIGAERDGKPAFRRVYFGIQDIVTVEEV